MCYSLKLLYRLQKLPVFNLHVKKEAVAAALRVSIMVKKKETGGMTGYKRWNFLNMN